MIDNQIAPILAKLGTDPADDDAWDQLAKSLWPIVMAARSRYRLSESTEVLHVELLARLYHYTDFTVFEGGRGFRSYVWKVMRNLGNFREISNSGVNSDGLESKEEFPGLSAYENLVLDDLLILVRDRLKPKEAALVKLLIGNDFSREELAQQLGMSLNALSASICRLKNNIQEILESG